MKCLKQFGNWDTLNGFRFKPSRTKSMHFIRPRSAPETSPSAIQPPLLYENSIKLLGLVWDTLLERRPQIAALQTRYRPGWLELSYQQHPWNLVSIWTHVILHRILVRSRLDYGAVVYNWAAKTTREPISIIINNAMRNTTDTFSCTPVESVNILANELLLPLRRNKLSLQY